jgi:hypothetical protein
MSTWLATGNAPTYLAALIAGFAAFFAYKSSRASIRTAKIATRQFARLREVEDAEKRAKHAAQAYQIAAWYRRPENLSESYFTIQFSNASNLPAYEIVIEIRLLDGSVETSRSVTQLPPGHRFTNDALNQTLLGLRDKIPVTKDRGLDSKTLTVSFNDAQGVRWRRNLGGRLAEVQTDANNNISLRHPETGEQLPSDYI